MQLNGQWMCLEKTTYHADCPTANSWLPSWSRPQSCRALLLLFPHPFLGCFILLPSTQTSNPSLLMPTWLMAWIPISVRKRKQREEAFPEFPVPHLSSYVHAPAHTFCLLSLPQEISCSCPNKGQPFPHVCIWHSISSHLLKDSTQQCFLLFLLPHQFSSSLLGHSQQHTNVLFHPSLRLPLLSCVHGVSYFCPPSFLNSLRSGFHPRNYTCYGHQSLPWWQAHGQFSILIRLDLAVFSTFDSPLPWQQVLLSWLLGCHALLNFFLLLRRLLGSLICSSPFIFLMF